MRKKKILFTGCSSFTGYWFIKELVQSNFDIISVFNNFESDASGLRLYRLNEIKKLTSYYTNVDYGSESFYKLMDEIEDFDIFCHHFFYTKDYKTNKYNITESLFRSIGEIDKIFPLLKSKGCKYFVYTGTVFEENEGGGSEILYAFSKYGLAKTISSKIFEYYCRWYDINFGKFVIPNPFGPFEDYKFTSYLADNWLNNKTPCVNTPDYVRDNIPVDLLAKSYVYFLKELLNNRLYKINPSGFIESNKDFANRLSFELSKRLGIKCFLNVKKQEDFSEPMIRYNTDSMLDFFSNYNLDEFWDSITRFYIKRFKDREL